MNEEYKKTEEQKDSKNNSGVVIPEEFQKQVNELVSTCKSKEALNFMEERARNRRYELEREKDKAEKGEELNTVGMPD